MDLRDVLNRKRAVVGGRGRGDLRRRWGGVRGVVGGGGRGGVGGRDSGGRVGEGGSKDVRGLRILGGTLKQSEKDKVKREEEAFCQLVARKKLTTAKEIEGGESDEVKVGKETSGKVDNRGTRGTAGNGVKANSMGNGLSMEDAKTSNGMAQSDIKVVDDVQSRETGRSSVGVGSLKSDHGKDSVESSLQFSRKNLPKENEEGQDDAVTRGQEDLEMSTKTGVSTKNKLNAVSKDETQTESILLKTNKGKAAVRKGAEEETRAEKMERKRKEEETWAKRMERKVEDAETRAKKAERKGEERNRKEEGIDEIVAVGGKSFGGEGRKKEEICKAERKRKREESCAEEVEDGEVNGEEEGENREVEVDSKSVGADVVPSVDGEVKMKRPRREDSYSSEERNVREKGSDSSRRHSEVKKDARGTTSREDRGSSSQDELDEKRYHSHPRQLRYDRDAENDRTGNWRRVNERYRDGDRYSDRYRGDRDRDDFGKRDRSTYDNRSRGVQSSRDRSWENSRDGNRYGDRARDRDNDRRRNRSRDRYGDRSRDRYGKRSPHRYSDRSSDRHGNRSRTEDRERERYTSPHGRNSKLSRDSDVNRSRDRNLKREDSYRHRRYGRDSSMESKDRHEIGGRRTFFTSERRRDDDRSEDFYTSRGVRSGYNSRNDRSYDRDLGQDRDHDRDRYRYPVANYRRDSSRWRKGDVYHSRSVNSPLSNRRYERWNRDHDHARKTKSPSPKKEIDEEDVDVADGIHEEEDMEMDEDNQHEEDLAEKARQAEYDMKTRQSLDALSERLNSLKKKIEEGAPVSAHDEIPPADIEMTLEIEHARKAREEATWSGEISVVEKHADMIPAFATKIIRASLSADAAQKDSEALESLSIPSDIRIGFRCRFEVAAKKFAEHSLSLDVLCVKPNIYGLQDRGQYNRFKELVQSLQEKERCGVAEFKVQSTSKCMYFIPPGEAISDFIQFPKQHRPGEDTGAVLFAFVVLKETDHSRKQANAFKI